MAERIASGEIHVSVSDEQAIRDLRKIDEQFDRTMRHIDGEKATVKIDGDLAPLDDAVSNAKRKVRQLEGERAEIEMGVRKGDLEQITAAIKAAKAQVRSLDGMRAEFEIDVKGEEKVLAARAKLEKLADAEAKALRRAAVEQDRRHRMATVGINQEIAKVAELERQYGTLADRMEKLAKRRPISRESQIKVTLEAAGLTAKMEAIKAQLALIGREPPVEIKVDVDRKGLRRVTGFLGGMMAKIGEKAAGLSDLTMRLGPFTGSIKQFAVALSFLGPTITDLLGATGALVGVLGAGISGAAALGAGALTGLATAGLGLLFATRNTRQELTQARTSISAYDNAVLKFGKNSDKAKKKQEEMNHVLKSVSPLARETALGVEDFFSKWDKGTKETQKNLGTVAKEGFRALDAVRPMMQRQTNELSGIFANSMKGVRKFFQGAEGQSLMSGIMGDFNKVMPQLMHGLGQFGHGFLRFAREGARNLGVLTGGIDNLGNKFLAFTRRDDFGATVKRWVSDARDLMRLFGAAGRVMMHFFGSGERAGQGLVKSMTDTLNKWDEFLTSARGHDRMSQGFERAADGARQLWHALAPLAGAFVMWANNLSPFITGILKGIGGVSKLIAKLTDLTGMAGPLGTLGVTLGAMWAVGKIGAFIAALSRVVTGLREAYAAGKALGALKFLFGGGALGALKSGGSGIVQGGAAAAAEMRAAIVQGGTVAAAEMRAALTSGGAANAATGLLGPTGKPIRRAEQVAAREVVGGAEMAAGGAAASRMGAGLAAARTAATALVPAIASLGTVTGALATGGLALVAAGAVYGGYKLLTMKSASEKLHDSITKTNDASKGYASAAHAAGVVTGASGMAMYTYRDSIRNVNVLKKELNQLEKSGGTNTAAYRAKLQELNSALQDRASKQRDVKKLEQEQHRLDGIRQDMYSKRLKAEDNLTDAQKRLAAVQEDQKKGLATARDVAEAEKDVADASKSVATAHAAEVQAAREAQLGELNYQRGLKGLIPLAGRAATALLNLRKRAPNLTQKIAVKFQDPKDAGQVAQRASAALKSGVSSKLVTKIVADSSSAEEAIRRINAAQIRAKILRIGHKGGDVTLGMLQRISGHKLTPKQQRILEKGGADALSMLRRLLGFRLNDKQFKAWLRTNAPGLLREINAGIDRLHDKSVTITTTHITKTMAQKRSGNAASGHKPGVAGMKLIGEGKRHEYVVDSRSGQGFKTPGPMFYNLNPTEAVIPTEPSFKARGTEFFKEIARDLGIPGFKKGRKPKVHHLSPHGKAKARGTARKNLPKKHNYVSENNEELPKVEKAKQKEEDQARFISILESQLKEPESFIKQVGTDPATGDPVYDVDQDAVNSWVRQLEAMAQQYDILVERINDVSAAIQRAQNRVRDVIRNATRNINRVQKQINHEQGKLNSNDTSVATKEGAKERIKVYKSYISDEKRARTNAERDQDMLADDLHDVPFRRIEAQLKAKEYRADAAATLGGAEKDRDQANPKPDKKGGGGGAGAEGISYERQTALTDVEMAAIREQYAPNTFENSQSGGPSDAMPGLQTNPALMPSAPRGSNDAVAAGALSGPSGANVASIMSGGSIATRSVAGGAGAAGVVGAAAPAAPAPGKTVNLYQTNNFDAPPPDPHTFTKGIQFEAGALV